ncbi:hypothetical protein AZA_88007 [Nitrospirillum viridazoti Y2]|uniref:Phage protein (TIGR02218 family) n=1 Tax=Nitrospirillum amazonense TaxID=28077 RepID=A0A560II56_9PROT|nr:DUF2163 domain-containing protein [Nitrospirillum amazonense]EGY02279.1 hypothetical protein AZA_88007 [Nitrospirillum amazonense Y2]TWB58676.1 putative phage protein (TIGR02218 family) [Nitrospirillum amazonense]
MKSQDPAFIAWLQSGAEIHDAELYTLTLRDGTQLLWTDYDRDISYGDKTWSTSGPHITRGDITTSLAVDVPELSITLAYDAERDLIGALPVGAYTVNGGLDGAFLLIERALMPAPGNVAFGLIHSFAGLISTSTAGDSKVDTKAKGANNALNTQMPRNFYQSPCINTLFGSACGVNRASFTWTNAVGAGSTNKVLVPAFALSQMTGQSTEPDPAAFFEGGLTFTGGLNSGATRSIKAAADGSITLQYPLEHTPGVGDPFTVTYGCPHTPDTCASRFNNQARFRGFPYIPQAETSA